MGEPVLRTVRVGKSYKAPHSRERFTALCDVNLSIHQGKSLGLVGGSGAGKSTLARLILGTEPPSEGEIFFEGQNMARLTGRERHGFRKKIQIIWQDPTVYLNPFFTVARLIAEPLEVFRMGDRNWRAMRVSELLEAVHLDADLAGRKPHELSGGQCQRVAIARALALNPRLLICDEALSGLDIPNQARMLRLLEAIQKETGMAYLFIAHDLPLVRRLCHQVAVIRRGRIVEQGGTEAVFRNPSHGYTRRLLENTLGWP
ncbi:ABC transporter ATP-binding protein [Desulfonema ishimotonii]|uniref:ABC transporter ATP-binding protein n=1 Tax=Desulfonema ishimotonii TaxID=45657 RepID=A0A401FX92_9BACT|nr:ATP-binding cassette domain-containing protein [Desulfonema ishimotonii]GBC61569.1 ABC transporter ATP-binding protein [Desulfonema ishimotonii]